MKKTIIALMSLAGMATAGDITEGLAGVWTFDNGSTNYVSYTGVTGSVNTGINDNHKNTTGGIDGKGYISTVYYDTEHTEYRYIDFYDDFSKFGVAGDSFTLSFKVRGVTADYRSMFSMKIDGMNEQLQFQTGNEGYTYLYGSGIQFTDTNVRTALRSETWNNIVLTGDGKNLTLYINGTSASTAYTPTTDALISNFQLGSTWGDGVRKVDADMDDLAIWNRVLDTQEIAALTSGSTALSVVVPEPTTATLSLLALAGLAARRRRQA